MRKQVFLVTRSDYLLFPDRKVLLATKGKAKTVKKWLFLLMDKISLQLFSMARPLQYKRQEIVLNEKLELIDNQTNNLCKR